MVLKALIIGISLLFSLTFQDPSLYTLTKKRADKVMNKYWQDYEHNLSRIVLTGSYHPELYSVQQGNSKPYAYVMFAKAPSKVDDFVFLVIFNPDGLIKHVAVLLYRENYGGEIASKRFLKQFEGKSNGLNMAYNQDINGISGATISVQSITLAIKKNSAIFAELIKQL